MRSETVRLLDLLEKEREAHAAERREWAEERKMLLNAALADTPGEFALRQHAVEERVVVQPGDREPKKQIIGM